MNTCIKNKRSSTKNKTNATTSSTTTTAPTIPTTSTTTTTSATGSRTGSSESSSFEVENFKETISAKEEIIENNVIITKETKKLVDKNGNNIEIEIEAKIEEDGSSTTKDKRTFIDNHGNKIKIEIKTKINADGSVILKRNIIVNEKEVESSLNILGKFEDNKVKLKAQLSNGDEQEIKIMPDEASEIALEKLKSEGFNIELKEVGEGDNLRAVYIAEEEKDGRLFGLFKITLKSEAQIDSETG